VKKVHSKLVNIKKKGIAILSMPFRSNSPATVKTTNRPFK